jgi:hypothetical protein
MSALGAQVNFPPFSVPMRPDRPNRLGMSLANASSNSPKGCHLIKLMVVSSFDVSGCLADASMRFTTRSRIRSDA